MEEEWDFTVSAKPKWFDFKIRELIRYRDLVYMFCIRDWTLTYKQTILGPLWYIISPLCSSVVYIFIFDRLAGIGTDNIPPLLFYFSGTMLWTYFTSCVNSSAGIFLANAGLFGKIYFPRLAVPIATNFGVMLKMLAQFLVLLIFLAYFLLTGDLVHPSPLALLFPLMFAWIGVMGAGLGMVVSALTTKYRDLNHVLALVLQLAMYVTPVVYPLSRVPERFKFAFHLNPLCAPVELFRIWFFGAGHVPVSMIVSSIVMTCAVLFAGLVLFTLTERNFVDVI